MSRILIQNATAENFAVESLASEPTSGSTGDHIDGRLVKFGTNVYIWNDNGGRTRRSIIVKELRVEKYRQKTLKEYEGWPRLSN